MTGVGEMSLYPWQKAQLTSTPLRVFCTPGCIFSALPWSLIHHVLLRLTLLLALFQGPETWW